MKYVHSNDFYVASFRQITNFYNGALNGLDSIEDQIYNINKFIDNYCVFNPECYKISDAKKMNDNCSICMDVCNNVKSCYQCNTCKHVMHKECIHSWFKPNNKTCPSCRSDWGTKKNPPEFIYKRRNNFRNDRIHIVNCINAIEYYFVDLLKHYYVSDVYKDDEKTITALSHIPENIIIHSLYSHHILKQLPIVADGNPRLFDV
tara:strand:+ start:1958 stop:2569 length:612 start_codon:yes stop_codon:yes gene_type:complete